MNIKEIYNKLKNSGQLSSLDYAATQGEVSRAIKKFIQDKKLIIHGAKAQNAQSRFPLTRESRDYDVFTRTNPKLSAEQLDKLLDRLRGGNYHYTKAGEHKGTHKVIDVGADLKRGTDDDFTLADFTRLTRKLKTIKQNNTTYSNLDELEKAKLRILKDKQFAYRHKKDKADLQIIQAIKRRSSWI